MHEKTPPSVLFLFLLVAPLCVSAQLCVFSTPSRLVCGANASHSAVASFALSSLSPSAAFGVFAAAPSPSFASIAALQRVVSRCAQRHPAVVADVDAVIAAVRAADAAMTIDRDTMVLMQILYGLHRSDPARLPLSDVFAHTVEIRHGMTAPLGIVATDAHVDVLTFDEVAPLVRELIAAVRPSQQLQAKAMDEHSVAQPGAGSASRCNQTSQAISCTHETFNIYTGIEFREVLYQLPLGDAPPTGWPAVIHYQGTFFAPHVFSWNARLGYPFGAYYQTSTIKALLDAGYIVITPETLLNGFTFWLTNIPPFNVFWTLSGDATLVRNLFDELSKPSGLFGRVDLGRVYATGISSGGYMTSRMAVDVRGRFKALVIHSGSYCICGGPICPIPNSLPSDHPPTLFLHGGQDFIVPLSTAQDYADQLDSQRIETRVFVDDNAGHEYFPDSVGETLRWFDNHP